MENSINNLGVIATTSAIWSFQWWTNKKKSHKQSMSREHSMSR